MSRPRSHSPAVVRASGNRPTGGNVERRVRRTGIEVRWLWLALLVLAACGSGSGDAVAFDWADPAPVELDGGLMVGPCGGGGEAPVACISRDGVDLALIEHGSAPLSTFPDVPAGAAAGEALEIITAGYLDSFGGDRAEGCPRWEFAPTGPEPATVAGAEGRVVGFALRRGGSRTELSESRFIISDDTVHWLTINLWDPATACLPDPERTATPVEDWELVAEVFVRVAAGSRF
jgi:hypothetical protein